MIRIAVTGAAGRMGRRIIALAAAESSGEIVATAEAESSPLIGRDAGEIAGIGSTGMKITPRIDVEFDVLIDFSTASATSAWLAQCQARRMPIVIGTTGHDAGTLNRIHEASKLIPILKSANMSVGVNLILRLVEELGRRLDASYDVEITETHHRHKIDAPSGTAIALRDAVVKGRGGSPDITYGRFGQTGARPEGQIGMHSLRLGDTVGEHVVSFGNMGETISVSHSAHSRDTFAQGALRAARWIVGKPPGAYQMSDVLVGG